MLQRMRSIAAGWHVLSRQTADGDVCAGVRLVGRVHARCASLGGTSALQCLQLLEANACAMHALSGLLHARPSVSITLRPTPPLHYHSHAP